MKKIGYIIVITQTVGWNGPLQTPRVSVHGVVFMHYAKAEVVESFIRSESRFGVSTSIVEVQINEEVK